MEMENRTFDDIRPFNDSEVQNAIQGLLNDEKFCRVLEKISVFLPNINLREALLSMTSVRKFQHEIIHALVTSVGKKTTTSLDLSGFKYLDKTKNHVFITNHRDIVLDSAFLNILLIDKGMETFEIAIGNNLLVYPWISDLVRLNKSFLVKRDLPVRQQLAASVELSSYMYAVLNEKNESVWLAQREGRAKDSNDRTQESVLKMLNLGGSGSVLENLASLNIVPVTISYEYDPCDYLKAMEMQIKRDNPEYKKTAEIDLMNMQTGILGFKGRVFYKVSPSISDKLLKLDTGMHKNELFEQIAQMVDHQIHLNYHLYPCNYIATDMLDGLDAFAQSYSQKEKEAFIDYIEKQLSRIEIPNRDDAFLRKRLLEMYSNPLKNKIKAEKVQ
jgi:hypothetical protein